MWLRNIFEIWFDTCSWLSHVLIQLLDFLPFFFILKSLRTFSFAGDRWSTFRWDICEDERISPFWLDEYFSKFSNQPWDSQELDNFDLFLKLTEEARRERELPSPQELQQGAGVLEGLAGRCHRGWSTLGCGTQLGGCWWVGNSMK